MKKDHAELFIIKDRQIQQYLDDIEAKNNKINELMNQIKLLMSLASDQNELQSLRVQLMKANSNLKEQMFTNEELEVAISANRDAYHTETYHLNQENDKLNEEIRRLNELLKRYQQDDTINQLRREIARLEGLLKSSGDDKDKEIQRLNKMVTSLNLQMTTYKQEAIQKDKEIFALKDEIERLRK